MQSFSISSVLIYHCLTVRLSSQTRKPWFNNTLQEHEFLKNRVIHPVGACNRIILWSHCFPIDWKTVKFSRPTANTRIRVALCSIQCGWPYYGPLCTPTNLLLLSALQKLRRQSSLKASDYFTPFSFPSSNFLLILHCPSSYSLEAGKSFCSIVRGRSVLIADEQVTTDSSTSFWEPGA